MTAGAEFEPHGLVVAAVQGAWVKPVGVAVIIRGEADGDGQVAGGLGMFTVQSAVGVDIREALASAVVKGGFGLMELRPAHLSLEEIFLQLTTNDAAEDA